MVQTSRGSFHLKTASCAGLANLTQTTPAPTKRFDVDSTQLCITAGCQCGLQCQRIRLCRANCPLTTKLGPNIQCIENGPPVPELSDCETLELMLLELTDPQDNFFIPANGVATAVQGTCEFAMVNLTPIPIESCAGELVGIYSRSGPQCS